MEHQFRVGDLVILDYPDYPRGNHTHGTRNAVEEVIRNATPVPVVDLSSTGRIRIDLTRFSAWWVDVCIVRYASEEARAEAERRAAEQRRKEEELLAMPLQPLIKEAKKLLMKSDFAKGNSNGVAIHLKRGAVPKVSTGPCHGFIRDGGSPRSAAIITLLVRNKEQPYGKAQCKKEVLEAYYDWLLARSPWSNCFYGRSGKMAVREGCAVLRTDVPANLLQGALISTRNTWEFPTAIDLWYQLVKKGVGENAAFVACHFVSCDGEQVRVCPVQRDHIAISTSSMTKEGLAAFLEGKPLFKQRNYNENGNYAGVHKAFLGRGVQLYDAFRQEFNTYGTVSKIIRNPFAKAKPAPSQEKSMTVDKYASFVKDIFPKLIA